MNLNRSFFLDPMMLIMPNDKEIVSFEQLKAVNQCPGRALFAVDISGSMHPSPDQEAEIWKRDSKALTSYALDWFDNKAKTRNSY